MGTASESQDAVNQREWGSSWNWSANGFYSSAADDRLWVPKRPVTGSGHALNLGHPSAKLFIAGLLIAPMVLIALTLYLVVAAN